MMGFGDGGFFGFHFLGWIFWVAVIIAVVWLVAKLPGTGGARQKSAREILDERYARGEIDTAEYEDRRRRIDGPVPNSTAR